MSSPRSQKRSISPKRSFGSIAMTDVTETSPQRSPQHRRNKKTSVVSTEHIFDENLPRVARLSSSVSDKAQQAAKAEALREVAARAALRYNKCKTVVFASDNSSNTSGSEEAPSSSLALDHAYHYSGEPWRKGILGGRNAAWTTDGKRCVYPSAATVVVHDLASNKQKFFFQENGANAEIISAVARHPFKDIFASAQAGKRPVCCLWELLSTTTSAPPPHEKVSTTKKNHHHQTFAELQLPAGSRYAALLRFSPCGRLLVSVGADDGHTATFWDWIRGQPLASYRIGNASVFGLEFHPFLVLDAKATSARDTSPLASLEAGDAVFGLASCGARHLKFWAVSIVEIDPGSPNSEKSAGLRSGDSSPKKGYHQKPRWCVDAGSAVIGKHPEFHTVSFTAVAPALDGCYVVGTDRGALSVWRQAREEAALILPPKGKCLAVFPRVHDQGPILDIAVSPLGKVATAGKDGRVRVFKLISEEKKLSLASIADIYCAQQAPNVFAPRSLCWDTSESRILVGTQGNAVIVVNDATKSRPASASKKKDSSFQIVVHGHVGRVTQIKGGANEGTFASVGVDRTLRIWDTKTRRLAQLLRLPDRALSLAFHPSGRSIALGCEAGDIVIATRHGDDEHGAGWALTSRRKVHPGTVIPKKPHAILSEAAAADNPAENTRKLTAEHHHWSVVDLKYSPNGLKLAACCADKIIYVFDEHFKRKFALKGHNAIPACIDFDATSTKLQSNDASREVLFWDCEKAGKQITNAFSLRNTNWATWTCVLGWYVIFCRF